jgi:hypothetical protein
VPAQDFELSGVIEAKDVGNPSHLWIGFYANPNAVPNWLEFRPHDKTLAFWSDGESGKMAWKPTPPGIVSFCIRARGKQAALFFADGAKPIFTLSNALIRGNNLYISTSDLAGDGSYRLGKLRLRLLPKDRKLDAPVSLPTTQPASPSAGPETRPQTQPAGPSAGNAPTAGK